MAAATLWRLRPPTAITPFPAWLPFPGRAAVRSPSRLQSVPRAIRRPFPGPAAAPSRLAPCLCATAFRDSLTVNWGTQTQAPKQALSPNGPLSKSPQKCFKKQTPGAIPDLLARGDLGSLCAEERPWCSASARLQFGTAQGAPAAAVRRKSLGAGADENTT